MTTMALLVKDQLMLAGLVFGIVELFKDLYPTASNGITRLAAYLAGLAVGGMAVWDPLAPIKDSLLLTLYQGVTLGIMAVGTHETVKRGVTDPKVKDIQTKAATAAVAAQDVKNVVSGVESVNR